MQNIKLHEATKQFGLNNKVAMFFLKKNGVPVKSHSSSISMDQLEMLREFAQDAEGIALLTTEFKEFEKEAATPKAVEPVETEETLETPPSRDEEPETVSPVQPPLPDTQPPVQAEAEKAEKTAAAAPAPIEDTPLAPVTEPAPVKAPDTVAAAPDQTPPPTRDKPTTAVEKPTTPEPAKDRVVPTGPRKVPSGPRAPMQIEIPGPDAVEAPTGPKAPAASPDGQRREKIFRRQPSSQSSHTGFRPPRRGGRKGRVKVTVQPKIMEFTLPEKIQLPDYVTLKEIADKVGVKMKYVEEKLTHEKRDYPANQVLKKEDILDVCTLLGVEAEVLSYEDYLFTNSIRDLKAELMTRPPIITVMGHVDHGKTTLLDTLRKTRVAEREAGGITQSIGAYELKTEKGRFVFIDTPGHEAFTNLRARGAKVTDVVILVVAANDGVQPQTVEAINHARSAEVPMIVAINKVDLQGADPMKVKQGLTKHGVIVEDWGGEVVSVEISAKHNQNIDALLEMISLVADMQELKSYRDIPARGVVIESRLDPKLGSLGTVLIQHGRLKKGDPFICGNSVGKVKALFDDRGSALSEGISPQPVEVMGFDGVPQSGDRFQVVDDIERAKKVIDLRILWGKEQRDDVVDADKKLSLQNLFDRLEGSAPEAKEIPILVKVDNYGSSEVLEEILRKQEQEQVKINIIHKGIGNISESDVLLASTAKAMIIGFNVKAPQKTLVLAKRESIDIRLYNVIYHLIEDIQKSIKGQIDPVYSETLIGKIEVLNLFKISRIGIVAGCRVKEGKITNKSRVKVLRNNELAFEGTLETLKRVKDEVSEVKAGTECGIKIKNYNAIEVGDIIEAYELTLVT
jgi:translation initiation factor IF-2